MDDCEPDLFRIIMGEDLDDDRTLFDFEETTGTFQEIFNSTREFLALRLDVRDAQAAEREAKQAHEAAQAALKKALTRLDKASMNVEGSLSAGAQAVRSGRRWTQIVNRAEEDLEAAKPAPKSADPASSEDDGDESAHDATVTSDEESDEGEMEGDTSASEDEGWSDVDEAPANAPAQPCSSGPAEWPDRAGKRASEEDAAGEQSTHKHSKRSWSGGESWRPCGAGTRTHTDLPHQARPQHENDGLASGSNGKHGDAASFEHATDHRPRPKPHLDASLPPASPEPRPGTGECAVDSPPRTF